MPGTIFAISAGCFVLERIVPGWKLPTLRDHNVLLFDFVLKRSLGNNGAGFARSVFETRPFFEVGT